MSNVCRLLKVVFVVAALGLLLFDALAGRHSVFRDLYDQADLNRAFLAEIDGACRVDRVRFFLRRGAQVDCSDERDETPLFLTVNRRRHGSQIPVIELLLTWGADAKFRKKRSALTPLHWAALWGYRDIARVLIDHGADVNARNDEGSTPLHYATGERKVVELWTSSFVPIAPEADRMAAIALLIEKGADVNPINAAGRTPLDSARAMDCRNIVKLLQEHGGKGSTAAP
ncbi:MAG: ankyrin repeat domain-containing protein [Planctomycetota bacterium]